MPLHQAQVVVVQELGAGDDAPLQACKELQFEDVQFARRHAAHLCVVGVGAKGIAQSLAGDGGGGDEEAVHGEPRYGEPRQHLGQQVDVVHGRQQTRRLERGVARDALQILAHADGRRRARVEAGQGCILHVQGVVVPHQLHQHVGNQLHQVANGCSPVVFVHLADRLPIIIQLLVLHSLVPWSYMEWIVLLLVVLFAVFILRRSGGAAASGTRGGGEGKKEKKEGSLVERYGLQQRLEEEQEEHAGGWTERREERERMLRQSQEAMILRARRRLLQSHV